MKYSMKWSEKDEVDEDIVVENDDCVEIFATEIETENCSIEITMIDDESVSVADNKPTCGNEENDNDVVYSDLMNSTTKIIDELERAKDDEDKCKTTHGNESLMEESLFETKTYEVKFDENYSSHEEWSNLLHEKHLIDELLFGEKRSSIAYTNQVKDNLFVVIELGKEVEDMKQPVVIATEAENEDYYATSEARKKDEERKTLLEEQNEKNQYGSSYDFSYDCNNVFECAGLQDNNSFSVVTDYEENMKENEEIDEENIESIYDENSMDIGEEDAEIEEIFMKWSLEEIKFYYELMLQQIDDQKLNSKEQTTHNDMWLQFTYK
jgi:hypothetical protein